MNDSASNTSSTSQQIQVMLVDDSAVIRGGLSRVIESDPAINIVSSVSNGEMAVSAAERRQPHVVILDIEMPVMDGLTALPEILKVSPDSKVVMFSSLTEKGADSTLKAFSLGAVECIAKPSSSQDVGDGSDFQKTILNIIKNLAPGGGHAAAAQTTVASTDSGQKTSLLSAETIALRSGPEVYKGKPSILAIGSSTGGPNALFEVIKNFQNFDIPIVLTQHMPATFTKILAQHITQQSGVQAQEAAEGMRLENGQVYVAPGGFHMKIAKDDDGMFVHIDDGPQENFCKPSVEPMFRSVIELFGKKVFGLILTGMGNDGINGGKLLADCGGTLVAQDEETSVVWGMPGAVAKAGYCTGVLPLNEIGPYVRKAIVG